MNSGTRSRFFKIGCGILGAVGLIILLIVAVYSSRITNMVYTIEKIYRRIETTPVEALGHGAIKVSFPNEEGDYVPGWYRPGDNGAAILFLHGLGGTRLQLVDIAMNFVDQGYSVLLIDMHGHGEHPARLTTFGRAESIDALAAVDWLMERSEVEPNKIGLYGGSMGAAACIHAAARDAESGENKIACAVADSSYASLREQAFYDLERDDSPIRIPRMFRSTAVRLFFFSSKFAIGKWADYPNPVDAIGKIECPLLLIHGDCDTRISPDSFDKLTNAARDADVDVETMRIGDGGHCTYHNSREFINELSSFFGEHLLDRPTFW